MLLFPDKALLRGLPLSAAISLAAIAGTEMANGLSTKCSGVAGPESSVTTVVGRNSDATMTL